MNKIEINLKTNKKYYLLSGDSINTSYLRKITNNILTALKINNTEISLLFCDNQIIKEINSKYRNKNYPTDVLAFESGSDLFLGDIAISFEKANEQSIEYEIPFEDELLRLLIHGILHLLGYDHEISDKDDEIMRNLEEKIFLEVRNYHLC